MEPPNKLQKMTPESDGSSSSVIRELKILPDMEAVELLEKDLPLLSNTGQVTVLHYLIKLNFLMNEKTVEGSLIIFVEPVMDKLSPCSGVTDLNDSVKSISMYPEEIILDCCSLEVSQVSALEYFDSQIPTRSRYLENSANNSADWFESKPLLQLQFELTKWALRISGWPSGPEKEKLKFPSVIRIDYKTSPKSPSLYWRSTAIKKFQYGTDALKQCVYTAASPVNNRGLFPCQEPPIAMATWEAFISVPKGLLALVTSDKPCNIYIENDSNSTFYGFSNHKLPMSTFAIVIGHFPIQMEMVESVEDNSGLLQTRMFSLDPLIDMPKVIELPLFIQNVLMSSKEILGPNPFLRLDIIIMPMCFHIMGLANPHMMFLSPILFSGNEENGIMIYSRIAHEIAHSFFGLGIGALDWREEWLSEGFATFVEDILYREAMIKCGINSEILDTEIELRIGLRIHTLQQELANNVDATDLKVIVPKVPSTAKSCKNGLIPMKQFNQVHYIKGFFFLRHLSSLVGPENFLTFLKTYVDKFCGKLVTSNDFVTFYCETFKLKLSESNKDYSIESLQNVWLHSVKLPKELNSIDILDFSSITGSSSNAYFKHLSSFRNVQKVYDELYAQSTGSTTASLKLTSNELVLLFEKIISDFNDTTNTNLSSLSHDRLKIFLNFAPEYYNPDAEHRWCEIILKLYLLHLSDNQSCSTDIINISNFLLGNPAMGIYLYGELMISENPLLQKLARNLFRIQIETLDFESKQVLKEMLF